MEYIICFIIAILFFMTGIIAASKLRNVSAPVMIRPIHCLFICVFSSSTLLFIPIYTQVFSGDSFSGIKTFLISLHNAIRLIIVDGEFDIIESNITSDLGSIWVPYSVFAAILFVVAPVLTFSALLSLIKNAYAYVSYAMAFFKDVYVFSELNEESIALALSIKENHPHTKIIYTDVFKNNDEQSFELMQKARGLLAIYFKNDIEFINYAFHSKQKRITFIAIGKDESENIRQSMALISKYKKRKKTSLFVFSSTSEGELLLSDIEKGYMKVRRINVSNALINRYLYEYGESIFDEAIELEDERKEIRALIVGLGQYGKDMVRALPWLCQMDGYRVYIEGYDKKKNIAEKFEASCPELMSPDHNGIFDPEDAEYEIKIHDGIDVDTISFNNLITSELKNTTFIFVATGDDNENVRITTNIRTLYERIGIHPRIVTVVHDSNVNHGLQSIHNFSGQPYDIHFIGAIDKIFSEKAVMGSDLENEALKRHLKWGDEEEFWNYEYNYKSSVATTIHSKMKKHCHIVGVNKKEEDLTEEERYSLERLEHRRWNAYMRSEGYVYSGNPDSSSRNNLAKMHHNLIPYKSLSNDDKRKDSKLTTE